MVEKCCYLCLPFFHSFIQFIHSFVHCRTYCLPACRSRIASIWEHVYLEREWLLFSSFFFLSCSAEVASEHLHKRQNNLFFRFFPFSLLLVCFGSRLVLSGSRLVGFFFRRYGWEPMRYLTGRRTKWCQKAKEYIYILAKSSTVNRQPNSCDLFV